MKSAIIAVLMMVLPAGLSFADEKPALNAEKDKISYSLGYQIGGDFKKQNSEIDPDALLRGIEDALSAAEPRLSPEEMRSTLQELKGKILTKEREQKQAAIERSRKEGREFLAQNAKKQGVVVLPSGLQYKILRKGTGRTPGLDGKVTVHYRGTLIDGKEFYNSRQGKETPDTFRMDAAIKGMNEALQLMKEGSEWQLFMTADLAYGESGPDAANAVIFHVELISVESGE
jgi:FKBP-type peptidyl-prolyl cis-trans isomerase FklB